MDLRELIMMLMHDADGGTDGGTGDEKDADKGTDVGDDDTGGTDDDTGGDPAKKTDDSKTFTQEELDRIIAERLAREQKKREDAVKAAEAKAESDRLVEEGKYKELAEKLQAQLAEKETALLATKKTTLLKDAGYSEEQAKLFTSLLQGETDDELTTSLELLKAANPPQAKKEYADPSAGNGRKSEPEKVNASDVGKSVFQRLKEKGKIK